VTRTTILIILGLMVVWIPPAALARDDARAAAAPVVPRKARWGPMKAEYLMANVTHPPLVFDSEQEKLRHEDARLRNLPGVLASGMYEVLRFPAELALCPVYLVTKPVWARERAEP